MISGKTGEMKRLCQEAVSFDTLLFFRQCLQEGNCFVEAVSR